MATFCDKTGRTWNPVFDAAAIRRIGLSWPRLLTMPLAKFARALARDPVKLAGTIHAACAYQAEDRGVEPEAFGRLLADDRVIGEATDALITAMKTARWPSKGH